MVPEVGLLSTSITLALIRAACRCHAKPSEFDFPGLRRTRAYTEQLLESKSSEVLWDGFGLVSDVVVSVFS